MLKDAHALWTAGMNALIPSGTNFDYEHRPASKEVELDQALTRLELEG